MISSETNSVSYTGNAVTTSFAYTFTIQSNTWLNVFVDGELQTLTTNYSVTGVGTSGGNVVFVTAPASAAVVLIERTNVPATQLLDYVQGDPFPADSHEQALDKITCLIQQTITDGERDIKFPAGDQANGTLPVATSRANSLLSFDDNGDIVMVEYVTGNPIDNFTQPYTGAVARTYQAKVGEGFVSVKDFGALGDGITNDIAAFNKAIAASKTIFIPAGTYLIEPTAAYGDFMLYLGVNEGNSDRSGMLIYGEGNKSIIKLGDNVGRAPLLFGAGNTDALNDMTFRDFAIDLNGSNNLQTSFADPLRYNNAFYFSCQCQRMKFMNLYIKNGSGSQWIRIGDDTSGGYGDDIEVTNCTFKNFGIAITNNLQQDVSVLYIQADGIKVINNTFICDSFTMDASRGHTACELHGDSSTIVSNNRFEYVQVPVLVASSAKANENIIIEANTLKQCGYLASLDAAYYDQNNIIIDGNIFKSTVNTASSLVQTGVNGEQTKSRDQIVFTNNTINCFGNATNGTHVFKIEDTWVKSLVITNNNIFNINGSLLYLAGQIQEDGLLDISIKDNVLNSLGSTGGGTYPTLPAMVHIETSSGQIRSVDIANNMLLNSANKNYSNFGLIYFHGDCTYAFVQGNTQNLSTAYQLINADVTNNTVQKLQSGYISPVEYRSNVFSIPNSSSVNLYNFSSGNGWGNNDFGIMRIHVWAGVGGSTNNSAFIYDIAHTSSGNSAVQAVAAGTYSADITLNFSSNQLRLTSTSGSDLTGYIMVLGSTTKPISWSI